MAPNTKLCAVPDCGQAALARGWCNKHYLRWRAHGDALYERAAVCSIEGCGRPIEGQGLCNAHYRRLRRHGETRESQPVRKPNRNHPYLCTVTGCGEPYYAHRWCRKHYDRWRQAGDPLASDRRTTFDPLSDAFWDQLDRTGGPDSCWPWMRDRNHKGYGVIERGRTFFSHRVAWTLASGPIPDGLYVLHRCDNPPCCNPAHLFLGTHADNMADMKRKGRARGGNRAGEENNLAKLTWEQVGEIRRRYPAESQTALAHEFGVRPSTISRAIAGKRWRE